MNFTLPGMSFLLILCVGWISSSKVLEGERLYVHYR